MLRNGVVARRFAARAFDFAKTASKVSSASARSDLAQLKAAQDDAMHQVKEAQKPVQPIDWAYYRENISVPGVVDAFEKDFKNLSLPSFENDLAGEVESKLKSLVGEAKNVMDASSARAEELKQLLAELEGNRISRNTTVDEYTARNPDVDSEAKAEIAQAEYVKDT
mmetsp:Transcript_13537/g.34400  ORF Transcript_13537/g.34400 Transcript_13537/m.34400 type:complete len:167 (-) Transcript_13537:72-572(-)